MTNMSRWRRCLVEVAIAVSLFAIAPSSSQALPGTSGLVSIPTATIAADGDLTAGMNRIAPGYRDYHSGRADENAVIAQFATVGFLPFVEVGLRLTRIADVPRQALGDRMVSVRVRLLKEGAYRPAVAVGVHDIVGTRRFHATYAVASKTAATVAGAVGLHVGYGHDVLGLRARGRQFDGLFGGVSVAPHRWITLVAEYDGERPSTGVRLGPVHGVALLAALQNFDAVSGGVSYTFALR
ncbi:MAG TPA: YjbH domain-containing protein [Longimicrobium sp.]